MHFSSMQIYSVYAMFTLLSLFTIYREIIGQTLTGIQDACSDVSFEKQYSTTYNFPPSLRTNINTQGLKKLESR